MEDAAASRASYLVLEGEIASSARRRCSARHLFVGTRRMACGESDVRIRFGVGVVLRRCLVLAHPLWFEGGLSGMHKVHGHAKPQYVHFGSVPLSLFPPYRNNAPSPTSSAPWTTRSSSTAGSARPWRPWPGLSSLVRRRLGAKRREGRWRPGHSLLGLPANPNDLFPDRLVQSAVGEIPEGWRQRPFGEPLNPQLLEEIGGRKSRKNRDPYRTGRDFSRYHEHPCRDVREMFP